MKLDVALSGATRLGLDTSTIIYFIEAHPKYDALVTAIFTDIATGRFVGVTSAITLTEVLIFSSVIVTCYCGAITLQSCL